MSEYRSELLAVNERIAALSAELARLGPKQKKVTPPYSSGRVIVIALLALIGACVVWVLVLVVRGRMNAPRQIVMVEAPPLPPDPPRPRTGLAWLEAEPQVGTQGQRFLDVDGDGKPELIGLSWDRAVPDLGQGLHVVALDARTLHPKWTSAPYAGHRRRELAPVEHLVVIPQGILVSDAHGVVHLLDPATGAQRSELSLGFPVSAACPAPDGSPRVLVAREAIAWSESPGPLQGLLPHEIARIQNWLIDPMSGAKTSASIHTFCDWSDYCGRNELHECRVFSEQLDAPRKSALDVAAHMVYRDGDARIGVGTITLPAQGDDAVPQRYAAARWSAETRKLAWKTPLSMRADITEVKLGLGSDVLVTLDIGPRGPSHLRALDAKTGVVRFDRSLDRAGIGTNVIELFAHGDLVYVARDGWLENYDATTGALLVRTDTP